MELIGDLERLVATNLYPYRFVLAALGTTAVIGIVILARRRGWLDLVRRYPGRTAAIALLLAIAVAPVTWYLASPLFSSATIVEAAPSGAAPTRTPAPTDVAALGTSAPPASSPEVASTNPPVSAPTALPAVERRGSFAGADEFHFSSGAARLIPADGGGWTLRLEDFAVRNGPDLFVYLSPRPKRYAKDALEVGRLKADRGAFNYRLPADVDPSAYRSVIIWCKQFAVQFAHATLDD